MYKRVRSLFCGGIEPVTTLPFGSSSLVPPPKELSFAPLGRSSPRTRLGAVAQSVFPVVLTTRLPSLPSNVLPVRFAPDAAAKKTANTAAAVIVVPISHHRPPHR